MTSSTPIRVLTVDDHSVVPEGIVGLVGVQPDMTMVAEAANDRTHAAIIGLRRGIIEL